MDNFDEAKGKAKEAAGVVSGDEDLKREGKVDQAVEKAKKAVDELADKVKEVLHRH